jgi:hypothetical protein
MVWQQQLSLNRSTGPCCCRPHWLGLPRPAYDESDRSRSGEWLLLRLRSLSRGVAGERERERLACQPPYAKWRRGAAMHMHARRRACNSAACTAADDKGRNLDYECTAGQPSARKRQLI